MDMGRASGAREPGGMAGNPALDDGLVASFGGRVASGRVIVTTSPQGKSWAPTPPSER